MAPFKEEVFNVIIDGQATGAVGVVPGEIDAGESGAGSVLGVFTMVLLVTPVAVEFPH